MKINNELWQKILDFDFDSSGGDYSFSVRLASENAWTEYFTQQALQEYRKFMYLAATAGTMVSPSEIVDIVWHQHLIFTQSYKEFCALLGKDIQHIPSTHNAQEAATFKEAATRTREYYQEAFGSPPKEIWEYRSMLQSLGLKQSSKSIKTILPFAVATFAAVLCISFFVLQPIYINLNNPGFLIAMLTLSTCTFLYLKYVYNPKKLEDIINTASENSFIHHLSAAELTRLKTGNIDAVINGCLGELLHEEIIEIDEELKISLIRNSAIPDIYLQQTIRYIDVNQPVSHIKILENVSRKPIFENIENSAIEIELNVRHSKKFTRLFFINFTALAVIAILLYSRVFIGYSRVKEIFLVATGSVLFTIFAIRLLVQLFNQSFGKTLANYYLNYKLSHEETKYEWQWLYLLKGPALLDATLLTVAYPNYNREQNIDSDSGYGSSCGGGSCGGGCGGCGGD